MRQGSVSEFTQRIVIPLGSEKQGEKSLKSPEWNSRKKRKPRPGTSSIFALNPLPLAASAAVRGVSALVTGVLLAQLFQLCPRITHVYCGGLSCRSCSSRSLDSMGSALVIACAVYANEVALPALRSRCDAYGLW